MPHNFKVLDKNYLVTEKPKMFFLEQNNVTFLILSDFVTQNQPPHTFTTNLNEEISADFNFKVRHLLPHLAFPLDRAHICGSGFVFGAEILM